MTPSDTGAGGEEAAPAATEEAAPTEAAPEATKESVAVTETQVITFVPEIPEGGDEQEGSCWTSSLSIPDREDAWRCQDNQNSIYDPCFSFSDKPDMVVCGVDPTTDDKGFVMTLTEPLPAPDIPEGVDYSNQAWLIELADGTNLRVHDGGNGCHRRQNGSTTVVHRMKMAEDRWDIIGGLAAGNGLAS